MRDWLKKLRVKKGLTQGETAKALFVSQQYYSMIEKGQRQVDLSLLMANKISNLFGVSLEHLVLLELKDKKCSDSGNM